MSVSLEPFTEADLDRLIGWIPDAAFLLQWAGPSFAFPLDRAQLLRHLEAARAEPPTLVPFRAVAAATGQVFGHVELASIQRAHGSAVLCRVLVGLPAARGRGLGRQMVRQVLRVGFEDLGLHRIGLNVFTHNRAALACYRGLGFVVEGTARDACRVGGRYWSSHAMALLEDEWRAGPGAASP